jgi:hypothetical protein
MKYFNFILLFVLSFRFAVAQNDGPGNTGLAFLKLPVTARAVGLGESVVSNSIDASATFYNPACLFLGSNVNAVFMHNEQVLGVRTEFLATKFRVNRLAFGVSLNNTAVNDIQVRDIPGPALDNFNAQNFAMGITAAYKVNDMLQLGITGKFLYQKIYVDNSSGYGFDFGGYFNKYNISAGLALSNIGKMSVMRSEATRLPASIRFGASYVINFPKINGDLRFGLDGFKVFDGGKIHANSGAEFVYKDFLSIRAGYQSGYEDRSFTTGVGLRYKSFNLDYAFVPYRYSLGNSHTFTLGASF